MDADQLFTALARQRADLTAIRLALVDLAAGMDPAALAQWRTALQLRAQAIRIEAGVHPTLEWEGRASALDVARSVQRLEEQLVAAGQPGAPASPGAPERPSTPGAPA